MVDIQVRNLTKFFVIGENLLDDLSFEIQEGERVAILGRNGCGKTTLFNILTGQMDYDSGEVYVNPNKRLGLISQIPKFPAGYTVEDVLRTAYAGLMKVKARMERLEADMAGDATAEQLRELINAFGLDAKVVERKEHYIVYLKEGEQIVDLLNIMEAPLALMDLENVRIVKEMRNDINRKVNCETANLNKVVGAAVKQLEDINYIEETIGLARLPEQLAEVARVRLEYPDRSLKELGSFLMTPVGKSGVNHRLRKISSIAEALREGKGGIE